MLGNKGRVMVNFAAPKTLPANKAKQVVYGHFINR